MSNFNQYFSTLTITYLLEAYALRKVSVINENELILNITSMVSVMGIKENIAIPSQNKHLYVEMLNKNSGIMMIVLDELVSANYIIRKKDSDNTTYMVNFEHDYIKKFIASHGIALKYVSHPSYILKRPLPNDENSLCEAIENMKISETITPLTPIHSKTKSFNAEPQRKKKKVVVESESDYESSYENEVNIVKNLNKAFDVVDDFLKDAATLRTKGSSKVDESSFGEVTTSSKVEKEENEMIISNIYSLQSESDLDKFYNVCKHANGTFTCTCSLYRYGHGKPCKHINNFLGNIYQKYDKFTLTFLNFFGKKHNDNTPVLLKDKDINMSTFKKYIDQKLYNNELISNYINDTTLYHGLYVWVFDDSLTDSKLEMKENEEYIKEKNNV